MIWATVTEVRGYLETSDIPAGVNDAALQRTIDKVARTLEAKVIRLPVLDEDTGRAADETQRGHIVAAVGETVKTHYEAQALKESLGGAGMVEVIAGGGSITAGKLAVSGGSKGSGGSGARLGTGADRVPIEAYEALRLADLIGGSVASW